MRFILALIVTLALVGCATAPINQSTTNNPNIKVEFLFEHDGCKVYRFYDEGNPIYYTNCGYSSSAEWDEPYWNGKTIVEIPKQVTTARTN